MNLKEYQELMKLLNDVTSRTAYLPKLFPTRLPTSPQIDFEIAQKKAFRDYRCCLGEIQAKSQGIERLVGRGETKPVQDLIKKGG